MIGLATAVQRCRINAAWTDCDRCPRCNGAGGSYWMALVYHNERQREWMACSLCQGGCYRVQRNAITGVLRGVR